MENTLHEIALIPPCKVQSIPLKITFCYEHAIRVILMLYIHLTALYFITFKESIKL